MTSSSDLPAGTSVRFDYRKRASPQLTRSKHRREFLHILALIEKNTGSIEGPNDQPAMAAAARIRSMAKRNGVDDPKNRMRACIEQAELVSWTDDEQRVCRARVEDLRAAIAEENACDHPNVAKLERLAGAIAEVRDA